VWGGGGERGSSKFVTPCFGMFINLCPLSCKLAGCCGNGHSNLVMLLPVTGVTSVWRAFGCVVCAETASRSECVKLRFPSNGVYPKQVFLDVIKFISVQQTDTVAAGSEIHTFSFRTLDRGFEYRLGQVRFSLVSLFGFVLCG
jgi:hypothetical protein